jgi:hypothetical protein
VVVYGRVISRDSCNDINRLAVSKIVDKGLMHSKRTINTSGKTPVRTYFYLDKESNVILSENKGESGVYR